MAGIKLQAVVRIVVGAPDAARFKPGESGAFRLVTQGQEILVSGSDPAGVLYGCLELIRRVSATGVLPGRLDVTDRPAFKIRGTNLFLMKSGEKGYDWPITRENFPWFFDRSLMGRYLDQLVESRYNTIFFWNGQPFPYLLELGRYPEARMLGDAELRRNIEHFRWFTREADRRGIWTVLHFYNIHVPPSFAKAHEKDGVRVQNPAPTPLLNAYMRYATSEFVNSYPSVGLMLTAGEALRVNQEEFVRDAIIAGIKDTGKHPPLIVRQWAIDADRYREVVRSQYDNLFTMMKHNTEMLVSPHPDPRNQEWVSFNQNHIINLHENSDVKPFRWGSPVFIRQMVSAWKQMGASGYHIYPMVSWLWPQSLDKAEPGILTLDRDWIWIEAFGRYGWNPDRAPAEEESFWKQKLARRFGSPDAANAVYDYYVRTGPILPGLQNMVSIVNMNWHPTAVSQEASLQGILVSDRTYGPGLSLTRPLDDWTLDALERKTGPLSPAARQSPPLSVKDFVKQTLASKPAEGVPPLALADLFVENALGALKGLEAARAAVRNEPNGYARFETDARAILQLAKFYRAKLEA
ncbi:MAG: hypothetical protein NTY38_08135, partial [Acidobacteria bacterium]|nr:hypothetical protein [Acidobacteriota bacterium]